MRHGGEGWQGGTAGVLGATRRVTPVPVDCQVSPEAHCCSRFNVLFTHLVIGPPRWWCLGCIRCSEASHWHQLVSDPRRSTGRKTIRTKKKVDIIVRILPPKFIASITHAVHLFIKCKCSFSWMPACWRLRRPRGCLSHNGREERRVSCTASRSKEKRRYHLLTWLPAYLATCWPGYLTTCACLPDYLCLLTCLFCTPVSWICRCVCVCVCVYVCVCVCVCVCFFPLHSHLRERSAVCFSSCLVSLVSGN